MAVTSTCDDRKVQAGGSWEAGVGGGLTHRVGGVGSSADGVGWGVGGARREDGEVGVAIA